MHLMIRGTIVVDGLGHESIRADIAVGNGRIAANGEVGKADLLWFALSP